MQKITVIVLVLLIHMAEYASGYASEFTLFYSNDIRAETEPCG